MSWSHTCPICGYTVHDESPGTAEQRVVAHQRAKHSPGATMPERSNVSPSQMQLGEVIAAMEAVDQDRILPIGFREPHSYRGDYSDLAFVVARDVRISHMLADARSAVNATFEGWKGGSFTMSEWTECWLVEEEGRTGETLGALLLSLLLAGRGDA